MGLLYAESHNCKRSAGRHMNITLTELLQSHWNASRLARSEREGQPCAQMGH